MYFYCSAKAADGDLAEHYRYGSVTGHRPGNLAERRLSDFLCGSTQPFRVSPAEHIDWLNWHIKADYMFSPEPAVKMGRSGKTWFDVTYQLLRFRSAQRT